MPTGDPKTCPHCGAIGSTFTAGRYDVCKACGERTDMTEFAFKPIRLQCNCTTDEGLLHIETSAQGIKVLWCTVCNGQKCAIGVTNESPAVADVLRYNETMNAMHREQERTQSKTPIAAACSETEMGPDISCPSCGTKAGWVHSDDHPESCYACKNCGEHYSRGRTSVYVPVGMTRDVANALLAEGPYDRVSRGANTEMVDELAEIITKHLTPLMVGKVVNPAYKGDIELRRRVTVLEEANMLLGGKKAELEALLSDAVSRGEELSHAIRRFDAGDEDATDRELKASVDVRAAVKNENRALEMLWSFIDVVAVVPRHGNVFVRAGESLERARHLMGQLKDAKEELSVLRKHSTREHISMADSEIRKLREKVNPA